MGQNTHSGHSIYEKVSQQIDKCFVSVTSFLVNVLYNSSSLFVRKNVAVDSPHHSRS